MRKIELFILIILEILPLYSEKIHVGALKGDVALIKIELAKGVDINLQDKDGRPVIMYAIINNQKKMVEFLIQSGANVSLKNKWGDTPLIYGAVSGNIEIINLLISAKVDINERNDLGETALMEASLQGYFEVVKRLIEKGANVNARGKDLSNAIMRAALKGYYDIALLLLEKGADPFTKDIKNKSANDYALERGNQDIVALFKDWKANPKKTLNKAKSIHMNAPNGVIEYKLTQAESNKEISKGKLEINKIDVKKMNIPVDEEEFAEQRTFKLYEEFIIGHSNYGKKDRAEICGFGMWMKRTDYNVLSWEWYEQESDNVFKKLQGEGRVRVQFRNRNGFYEIAKIYFVGDQIFRARKVNFLALLTTPNKEDWYCTIYNGSYIIF